MTDHAPETQQAAKTAPRGSVQRIVRRRATDETVRDLPVIVKLKLGQVIVEQSVCGIIFSFPAAVWPHDPAKQRAWVQRLTPWWDMDTPDWTPQAHRLRESCLRAINILAGMQTEQEGARDLQATPGANGAARLQTRRSGGGVESPNAQGETRCDA